MLTKLILVIAIIAIAASPVLALTASKTGEPVRKIQGIPSEPTDVRFDWSWSTGGMDAVPTTGGSFDGWGEWFITTCLNDSGNEIYLTEFGWPCCGPPTDTYGWLVWKNMPGIVAPPGSAFTAEYYGSYTPVDPSPDTFPPITYTYIDVTAENIIIQPGEYFCFGYDNTGNGGQIDSNGVDTWAWYGGMWDPDAGWFRTALLQVKASYTGTPVDDTTWGKLKALYR